MKKGKLISLMAGVVIVVAGASFYGGMQYANTQKASPKMGQGGQQEQRGQGANGVRGQQGDPRSRFGNGGGMVTGQITAKDDKSITVKSPDGSSKIIFYSDKTSVGKSDKTDLAALAVGQNVVISGRPSPDGSVSAQDVQIKATP